MDYGVLNDFVKAVRNAIVLPKQQTARALSITTQRAVYIFLYKITFQYLGYTNKYQCMVLPTQPYVRYFCDEVSLYNKDFNNYHIHQ